MLYRDGLILVINKPAGMAVHKGRGAGAVLDRMALRFGKEKPPEVAHRLDRDTTGCLVLGRHPKALRMLAELFAQGKIAKTYWAVVDGRPPEKGVIEAPIRQVEGPRTKVEISANGQPARTEFRVLQAGESTTWLELKPRTGRTHQLRIHLAHIGHPILGDPLYGDFAGPAGAGAQTKRKPPGLLLHARKVEIPLYPRKAPVAVEAPLPESWTGFIQS